LELRTTSVLREIESLNIATNQQQYVDDKGRLAPIIKVGDSSSKEVTEGQVNFIMLSGVLTKASAREHLSSSMIRG